mmetsp:Transcript_6697/g.10242  ORF Transcript_6697/g.10242 Transcript_6697/m.10242 type:complete len:403 (+) Transcript_6697:97-1305(+)
MGTTLYRRDDWTEARTANCVLNITTFAFFSVAHTISYFRRRIKSSPPNVTALRTEILRCNYFALIFVSAGILAFNLHSTSESEQSCRTLVTIGAINYVGQNFLIYRVLLYRAKLYDVMKEYQTLYRGVYIFVHVVCPCFLISTAIILGVLAEYEIIENPDRKCALKSIPILSTATALSIMMTLVDLAVSLSCLYLLLLPIFTPTFSIWKNSVVFRNILFSSLAVLSTFVFLVFITAVELLDGWYPGLLIDLGIWDVFVNFWCINLCWPIGFYFSVFGLRTRSGSYNASDHTRSKPYSEQRSRRGASSLPKSIGAASNECTFPTGSRLGGSLYENKSSVSCSPRRDIPSLRKAVRPIAVTATSATPMNVKEHKKDEGSSKQQSKPLRRSDNNAMASVNQLAAV